MRIALYDNEKNVLDKYKTLLCAKIKDMNYECRVDCFTEQDALVKEMEGYDLVALTEHAMKYLTMKQNEGEVILVSGNRVETISVEDIVYIEADLKRVHFFLIGGGEIVIRLTFREVEQQLSKTERKFIKIHRSYIVAMDMIRRIEGKSVYLKDGMVLPVSKYRLQEVIDSYLSHQETQAIIIREPVEEEEPAGGKINDNSKAEDE